MEVEALRDELQEWRDNLPENLSDGDKANQLDDAISSLESGLDSLESATSDLDGVDFPSMY